MHKVKLERQLKKFESYLMVDRGLSSVTASGYCRTVSISLRRMKKFVPQYPNIKEHVGWMYEKKYSYSHIVNTSLGLEHYTRFKGSVVKLARPKKPKRLIKDVLSEAEISRIIQSTVTIRQKAILCLLAYSGLRNQELCNLLVSDVDLGGNQVTVRDGKNRQDGVINIAPECTRVLIEYLREFPRENDGFLFTTLVRGNQLKTGDVRKTLRVVTGYANIGRRVYPHLFRHSLATNLLNRGGSLMMIQQQLRHRFIESTMIYVESRPVRNRSEYDFHKPAYM
ncbi:MAG: tyrosine-type recombinase/integrase [Bdellovibrionales bacterium]|nr:tyrosine-type recombinase/integrase [Bdellovibrionales bacterium]